MNGDRGRLHLRRAAEIFDGSCAFDVAVRSRAVEHAHVAIAAVYVSGVAEDISRGEDFVGDVGLPKVLRRL